MFVVLDAGEPVAVLLSRLSGGREGWEPEEARFVDGVLISHVTGWVT